MTLSSLPLHGFSNSLLAGLAMDVEAQDFAAKLEALPLPLPGFDHDGLCADVASPAGLPRVVSLDFVRAFRGNELQPSAFEPACSGSAAPPPLVPQLPLPLPAAASAAAEGVETPTCLAVQPTVAALMHSSRLQLGTPLPLPAVPAQVPLPLPAMVPTSTLGCAPAVPSSIAGSDGGAALSLPSRPGSVGPGHASDGPCQATSSKPKAAGAGGKAGAAAKGGKGGKGKDRATMTQAEKAALRRARRMLSNRESARRSRKRKVEQLNDLEGQVRDAQGQLDEANDKVARLTETLAQRDEELACLKRQLHALKRLLPLPGAAAAAKAPQ
ncbi:hypothetical protein COHA_003158 [Chlorella ohadii]|uniref:BZIP domain-containing protein n=1 Tax=Chlorella ohadii TaxID=2649997 RepID=A0AAD5DVG4_9CHLO|nr:hypothetical protein COHA_003158 [Chlorella ohadii]